MFPTIMPWPMALAPTNEATRGENHMENPFSKETNYHYDLGGHKRCKDSITIKIKKGVRFCKSRRKRTRIYCPYVYITPNSQNYFICKWLYSPDVKLFHFDSTLNPDSSIHMNCCDSPWLFAVCRLSFVEDTFFNHLYLSLTL